MTLWRDIKHQSEFIAARQIPLMKLIRDIDEEKIVYEFNVPEIVIGRDQRCDLILEESTVSAEHARLSYHHGNWWVEDLQSRNGTLLNLGNIRAYADKIFTQTLNLLQAYKIPNREEKLKFWLAGKEYIKILNDWGISKPQDFFHFLYVP